MIDFMGGVFGMITGYTTLAIMCLAVVFGLSDHARSFITGQCNVDGCLYKLDRWLSSEVPEWVSRVIGGCGVVTVLAIAVGLIVTHGGAIQTDKGHDLIDFFLFPYWVGTKASWVLMPIGLYVAFLFSARAIYRINIKVKDFSKKLKDHMKDKDAHK